MKNNTEFLATLQILAIQVSIINENNMDTLREWWWRLCGWSGLLNQIPSEMIYFLIHLFQVGLMLIEYAQVSHPLTLLIKVGNSYLQRPLAICNCSELKFIFTYPQFIYVWFCSNSFDRNKRLSGITSIHISGFHCTPFRSYYVKSKLN